MTDEELDLERAKEAHRISYNSYNDIKFEDLINLAQQSRILAAKLAREGWVPPAPVDPLLLKAREIGASMQTNKHAGDPCLSGDWDNTLLIRSTYKALQWAKDNKDLL